MLKLAPHAFWAATPREIAAAARGLSGAASVRPMARAGLQTLMSRYPDEEFFHGDR